MVINTHYRFLFVHIPKAAGTSVMDCLATLKGNNRSWLAGTKHETLAEFEGAWEGRQSPEDRRLGFDPLNYFRFGFVRNPWDRMSSLYRYLVEQRPVPDIDSVSSFKDFLVQADQNAAWIRRLHSLRPQVDFFTTNDRILSIDFLGHFEHLLEELKTVEQRIGCALEVPHLNRSSNHNRDYRNDYDSEMVEIVGRIFADDVRHLGYGFEQAPPSKRCSGRLIRPR